MQGWEVLTDSFVNTNGVGVGLYNMEKAVPGYIGEILFNKLGRYQNRAEGSFFASKLVTEFGFVGIIVLIVYCAFFLRSLRYFYRLGRRIDKLQKSKVTQYPVSLIYAHSVIVVFAVEAFVRGVGYFSTGVFLLIVAFFLTRKFHLRKRLRFQNGSLSETIDHRAMS